MVETRFSEEHMPRSDRLAITISLVMVGLALAIIAPLPPRALTVQLLGSELSLTFSGPEQLAVIMVGLVCAGVDAIQRAHPRVRGRSLGYTATFWVLPAVVTTASLVLLGSLDWWGYHVLAVGLTGGLLSVVAVSQYRSVSSDDPAHRTARLTLNAIVYIVALIWFVALYGSRMRSIVSAGGVALASMMLALDLLRSEGSAGRTWIYAAIAGLMMGELTWALNYLAVDARIGGSFLLLAFYTLTGIMQQHFWQRLTRRVAFEYLLVTLVGLGMLSGVASWFGDGSGP